MNIERVRDRLPTPHRPPDRVPRWRMDYCELEALETLGAQEKLLSPKKNLN